MERVLEGEPMSKRACWAEDDMVVLGEDIPESGCLNSRSAEGSRDSTRCSTLCREQSQISNYTATQCTTITLTQ